MTVIARDGVASDHLVYAWPFPIGPDAEVACGDEEQVVMCPAWLVGDRLGPGRHMWRTPDPSRPVSAFFVLTAPVDVSFDMTTMFIIPATGQPVRLRANGALQIRCSDPGLLIAQFVGLPFDGVNEGILRSVSRSVERMLARLLTRRVVMAGSPLAVTDPAMLGSIVEELIAYNPTAGAVFGVELIRMGHLLVVSDDGSNAYIPLPREREREREYEDNYPDVVPTRPLPTNGDPRRAAAEAAAALIARMGNDVSLLETARGRPVSSAIGTSPGTDREEGDRGSSPDITGPNDPAPRPILQSSPSIVPPPLPPGAASRGSGDIVPRAPSEPTRRVPAVEVPQTTDEITQPGVHTPVPGTLKAPAMPGASSSGGGPPARREMHGEIASKDGESRGAIFGIGMSAIGHGAVSGEIPTKVPPGGRVLVPGPNGLMQSATVRQLLQGYYELEVGHSGETIWVPINGVVPEH
jgi:hypothetical protein